MKILVVDDEPLIRRALIRLFSKLGCEVFEAEDGFMALNIWSTIRPDLAMIDVLMPGMTGVELLERLLSNNQLAKTRFFLMSAFSGDFHLSQGVKLNMIEFIQKPFADLNKLMKIVEEECLNNE